MNNYQKLELKVLGCGDAFGNEGRFNTSFLISNGVDRVLLDCGASTLIRLKQEGISLASISTIVISHFHGDHYGGLPFFLISSLFESPRTEPLNIVGPQGVEERVRNLQDAMYPGTSTELSKLDIRFYEYLDGETICLDSKRIEAFPVNHSLLSNPHGVRLHWEGKTIAFSGDTSWTDNLPLLAENADVFICECNFLSQRSPGHLSYEEILEKEELLTCRMLLLTHMNSEVIQASDIKFDKLTDGAHLIIE